MRNETKVIEQSGHVTYAEVVVQVENGREFTGQSDFRGLADGENLEKAYQRAKIKAIAKAREYLTSVAR